MSGSVFWQVLGRVALALNVWGNLRLTSRGASGWSAAFSHTADEWWKTWWKNLTLLQLFEVAVLFLALDLCGPAANIFMRVICRLTENREEVRDEKQP